MDNESRIALLEQRLDALEERIALIHETQTKRIDDIQANINKSNQFVNWSMAIIIAFGIVQIVIALLK